jgi:sporulation protein YlmC with PRC-barrel domain
MGQQELRVSKLTGAEVKTITGETIGKIEDALINPMTGRIDFAVISYNSSGTTSPGAPTSPTAASSGKLIPIPWSFLRAGGMGGNTPGTATSAGTTSFLLHGDKSRLESAPSFDPNNWPDVSQTEWRQRIYSHFGMQPQSATGGATAPGGTGSSTTESGTTSPATPRSDPTAPRPQN